MNTPDRFDPDSVDTFRVLGRSFEEDTRTLALHYAFDDAHRFVETITFETATTTGGAGAPGF